MFEKNVGLRYNPNLYSYQGSLVYPFWAMDAHFRWVEKNRANELAELDLKFTSANQEQNVDLQNYLADQNEWLEKELPSLQWRAQFLLSFSQLEVSLAGICTVYNKECGYGPAKFKSKDPKKGGNRGIQKSADWMIEVLNVTEPYTGLEWQLMLDYGVLRNTIAHQGGEVSLESEEKAYKDKVDAINRINPNMLQGLFDNDPYPSVALTYDFVRDANSHMRKFVELVASQQFADPS